jgi:hypothetical protein
MGPRSAAESTVGWRVCVVKQVARELLSETLAWAHDGNLPMSLAWAHALLEISLTT